MRVSIFLGDISLAAADAVCTSTNPRLSLVMGTGAAIRERGGHEILRECEAIVGREGPQLPAGSAHVTTAGSLPHQIVIHCVASDTSHRSSEEIVRACVTNALAAADAARCRSVAMPVFGAGHAHMKFERSLSVIAETARDAATSVEEVVLVILDPERVEEARRIASSVFGGEVNVTQSEPREEAAGWWSEEE